MRIPALDIRVSIELGTWALPFAIATGDGLAIGVLCVWFTIEAD